MPGFSKRGDHYVMKDWKCEERIKQTEPRSAIGYGPDRIVLLSSDHRGDALKPNIPDLCDFFKSHGIKDAMLLDGGNSAQLYVQGQGNPGEPVNPIWVKEQTARRVANAIGIVKVCNTAGESCAGGSGCCGDLTCQSGTCAAPTPPGAVCGNGTCEVGEACDGADLDGNTCTALGFDGGALLCSSACSLNTSGCCDNECTSGSVCIGNVLKTCGNYDSDPCMEWSGGMTCPNGCSAGACQGPPGPACSVVYTQGFEDLGLFSDDIIGSQPFKVGAQQVGQFWDAGVSRIRHGTGHSPSARALSLEAHSSGGHSNTFVDFIAPAASNQTLRVSFYAYNPYPASYNIVLQRAGGPMVTRPVPPGDWALISADLTSSISTTTAIVHLGLIPNSQGSFAFKMDGVVIERCMQ